MSAAKPGTTSGETTRILLRSRGLQFLSLRTDLLPRASTISGSGLRQINLTGKSPKTCPAPRVKIFRFPSDPNQRLFPRCPVSTRGVSRSSRTRDGMWWTRQRQARRVVCRAVIRERARRARRTALKRTAKPCGPDTRGWCQAAGGEFDPTGSISHQAGSDGGKTNSSPGRARHKPSNHCAGNAGVLRLYLYARVRTLLVHIAHETAGAASTRHSLLPLSFEGQGIQANLGRIVSRERETVCTVIASAAIDPCVATKRSNRLLRCAGMTTQTVIVREGWRSVSRDVSDEIA